MPVKSRTSESTLEPLPRIEICPFYEYVQFQEPKDHQDSDPSTKSTQTTKPKKKSNTILSINKSVLKNVFFVFTFEIVSAGLHCSLSMSRQILPWELTLG